MAKVLPFYKKANKQPIIDNMEGIAQGRLQSMCLLCAKWQPISLKVDAQHSNSVNLNTGFNVTV